MFHPHLHSCTGGGLSTVHDGSLAVRTSFLPVRVLSRLFRRLFLRSLQRAFDSGKLQFRGRLEPLRDRLTFVRHLAPLKRQEWVVYAKRPFAGPHQVLDYVGRHHRVAISNNRLLDIENGQVRFQERLSTGGNVKTMTLAADEFIRRFLLHVLPNGFQRIRYYGFREPISGGKLAHCRRLSVATNPTSLLLCRTRRTTETNTKISLAFRYASAHNASVVACCW